MSALDPHDVLEVTLGLDARPVRLPGVTVVRTQDRPDAGAGNAVHHREPVGPDDLDHVLADAARRFGHPDTTARAVVHHDAELAAAAATRDDVTATELVVAVLDEPVATPSGWSARGDLTIATPADDRAWHAITVLHRHAGSDGDDRARGAADDRLRWWVDGQRQLVALGRMRLVRAERFGTPVGTAGLIWEPRVDVGPDHAGLAVLHDVIVHPAHRQLGVASTMAAQLLATHLADFPRARVATVAPAALAPALEELGWRVESRLLVLEQPR